MPKFQPIPNFDSLAPTTTKGDIIVRTSSTNVRQAIGSDGQALIADSTQTNGLKWGSPAATAAFNVVSKTTTYSAVINDYILASSSSFTITLPTAVGVSGQQIAIQHNGTSLSAVFTLNTTSAQTIGGIASGSYALYTNGETLWLVSDGANWQIVGHKATTSWQAFASVAAGTLITGSTSNPTYGTVATNQASWRRVGPNMEILWSYRQSAAGAGATGSGIYLLNLPSGATIDTTIVKVNTSVTNSIDFIESSVGTMSGAESSNSEQGVVGVYSTTQLKFKYLFAGTTQGNAVWGSGSGNFAFASSAFQFDMNASVPISGWQP